MGMSVLQKMVMFEKQVKQCQQENERLAAELLAARFENEDLEERIIDLAYLVVDIDIEFDTVREERDSKEKLQIIRDSMERLATENEVLLKEKIKLENTMTYINQRLDVNILKISQGEVIVPQADEVLNTSGISSAKLVGDNSERTSKINPEAHVKTKDTQHLVDKHKKRSRKYSDPLGAKDNVSDNWKIHMRRLEPKLTTAHNLTKKRYPESTTAGKKPLDVSSRYNRYSEKQQSNRSESKSRMSTHGKAGTRIPVKPSVDLSHSRNRHSPASTPAHQSSSETLGKAM